MASILDSVDARTKLVGKNRLEILMFRLAHGQLFAINVFKVQEVQHVPKLNNIPESSHNVIGVTTVRGQTIPVIDLARSIGMFSPGVQEDSNIVVTEYYGRVQAFLVQGVERIVNLDWGQIQPPPKGTGRSHYLTAFTRIDDKIVEIIDVEKVLSEVMIFSADISDGILEEGTVEKAHGLEVLLVDDSTVALNLVSQNAVNVGLKVHTAPNGEVALMMLKNWAENEPEMIDRLLMVVTDGEMPQMDGYRLTTEIRADPNLAHLYVVMHTSMSGSFNESLTKQVGCNDFISKFQPDELAAMFQDRIKKFHD